MKMLRAAAALAVTTVMVGAPALPAAANPVASATNVAVCISIFWAEPEFGDVTVVNDCAPAVRMKAQYLSLVWGSCQPVWGYNSRVWKGTVAPVTGMDFC